MASAVRTTTDSDGVLTIWLDLPDKSVNTLSVQMWSDLDSTIAATEAGAMPRGIIVASAKPRTFIAGADLFEMRDMTRDRLDRYLKDGQEILDRLERLPVPTVAAINGDTLGGGLEVALACRMRVAIDEPSIKIGLPETTLGLVPGWGGTVRLPRLIGLGKALPLMLHGKNVAPAHAYQAGIVDQLSSREHLLDTAKKLALNPVARKPVDQPDQSKHALDAKVVREQILQAGEADVRSRSGDNLPAPLRLIQIVRDSYDRGLQAGFDGERVGLCDLKDSEPGRNLMRLFFLRTGAKKAAAEKAEGKPREVKSAAVLGGGTMGAGIAHALARSGFAVKLIELNSDLADKAVARVRKMIDDDFSANRIDATAQQKAHDALTGAHTWDGIADVDLVIEAVLEQMPIKQDVFRRLGESTRAETILASNTSSLSVSEMAASAAHPNRVVGIHFFNPVPRMPLVEIVRTSNTDVTTLATAVAVAGRLGKTAVITADSPGFLVNRVLFPYLAEAMRACSDGVPIFAVDEAIESWGMPMGPFRLMDEIGLDVTAMILRALSPKLGERLACPDQLSDAVADGLLGRKSGRGFYVYSRERGVEPQVNHELAESFTSSPIGSSTPSHEHLQLRLMLQMVNEAAMCLQERVVDSTDSIDLATVTGLGFAPFRGGLARYCDFLGTGEVVTLLRNLQNQHGEHFKPCRLLKELSRRGMELSRFAEVSV